MVMEMEGVLACLPVQQRRRAITTLPLSKDGAYNPKQRRNAGAPPTSEIVAQMATYSYSLYEPLKN